MRNKNSREYRRKTNITAQTVLPPTDGKEADRLQEEVDWHYL